MSDDRLSIPAETRFEEELQALVRTDAHECPANWKLSPRAVVVYLMGGEASDGTVVTPKYIGNRRLIETAVATLATDRGAQPMPSLRTSQCLHMLLI